MSTSCSDASAPKGPGAPATLLVVAGNGQAATVATTLPDPVVLRVVDAESRGVPNVSIRFDVSSTNGQVSVPAAVSNDSGIVRVAWTLGSTAGEQGFAASLTSAAAIATTIRATAHPGPAIRLQMAGTIPATVRNAEAVAGEIRVVTLDSHGNVAPTPNLPVTASLAANESSLRRELRGSTTANTDATGTAVFSGLMVVGDTGSVSLSFQATSLAPVGATLRVIPGAPVRFEALSPASIAASVTQRGPDLNVRVADVSGNPVPGVRVSFTYAAGNASTTLETNANGMASFAQWTLPNKPGVYLIVASVASLPDIVFSVTATSGSPATIVLAGAADFSGNAGDIGPGLQTRVTDALGNPAVGVPVTFTVTPGVRLGEVATDASGLATLSTWRFPSSPASYVVSASAAGTNSVEFRLTVRRGPASRLELIAPPSGPARVGFLNSIGFRVTDLGGNVVPDVPVEFAVISGPASVSPSVVMSTAYGIVYTTISVGTTVGTITIRARLPSGVAADHTFVSESAGFYALTWTPTEPSVPVSSPFAVTIRAVDHYGNGVPSTFIGTWPTAIEGTSLVPPQMATQLVTTDANGYATLRGTTSNQPGVHVWSLNVVGRGVYPFKIRVTP
jgi:hypothetical protein